MKTDVYLPKPRQDPKEQHRRVNKDSHKLMNKMKMAGKKMKQPQCQIA